MIRIEFQVSLPSSLIVFPVAQVFTVVNNTWPAREEAFMTISQYSFRFLYNYEESISSLQGSVDRVWGHAQLTRLILSAATAMFGKLEPSQGWDKNSF
jgi:hypothetical protein